MSRSPNGAGPPDSLSDLGSILHPPGRNGVQLLTFLCPKCRGHQVFIHVWGGAPTEMVLNPSASHHGETFSDRVWNFTVADLGPGWSRRLTVSPSVNREGLGDKCGGWHGHIINGEAI